jgi:DeoR/GlpR family transcriptional regulator of sugar metabolism
LNNILKTEEIDILITQESPEQNCLLALENSGVKIHVATKQ